MNIIYIAYYTLLRNIRDVKSMMNMIAMPVLLILILGNALNFAFKIDNISKTGIAYLNLDKGEISKEFENYLKIDKIQNFIYVKNINNYDEGLKLLGDKEVAAIVIIEEDYSKKALLGEKAEIKVFGDKNNVFKTSIVKNFIEGFTSGSNTVYTKMSMGSNSHEYTRKDIIKKVPLSIQGKIPGAMDYYAVTMLVMITMYGALYALHGVCDDYLEAMGNRLFSTPVRMFSHFSGKIIGTVATVYLQLIILIGFTKLVYKANWGNNIGEILFIAFTLSVFSVSLGLMVSMIVKDKNISTAIVSTAIPVMTFVSGGYARIISDNKIYNAIKFLLPSNLGQTAFFNSIYGDYSNQIISNIAVIWILIIIIGGISVVFGRRRLA